MANVKISTTNTTDGYQEPLNPNTTGALAAGFYPQNATSNDDFAGVERDSTGRLALRAGGVQRVYLNPSTGAMGVGTTDTLGNSMLDVLSGVTARTAAASGVDPYLQLYNGNAGTDLKTWRIGADPSGGFNIQTINDAYNAATTRVSIDSNGSVVIAAAAGGATPLSVGGYIQSTTSGFKFPDASTQGTSAGSVVRVTTPNTTTGTSFTNAMSGVALAAGTPYFFQVYLIWSTSSTSGSVGFAMTGPSSPVVLDYLINYQQFANDTASTALNSVHATGYDSGYTLPASTTAANTAYFASISGVIVTGANAGNLVPRFKSNNSSYVATIRTGSWMLVRRGTS